MRLLGVDGEAVLKRVNELVSSALSRPPEEQNDKAEVGNIYTENGRRASDPPFVVLPRRPLRHGRRKTYSTLR